MANEKSLEEMNMGQLWALARLRGIEFKGKKKPQLIKELIAADKEAPAQPKEETKTPKAEKGIPYVEATLADGTKVKIPAKDVKPVKAGKSDVVVIKSVDGRELEASVGREHWVGKTIEVPAEMEEEVRRLLTIGGYYFV